jgi:DNA-binding transcriptional MocR family regulator
MCAQAIVYEFCLAGDLERSIETVKAALEDRARTLAAAIERELPGATFTAPEGGYFMWVTLPSGLDAAALVAASAERGVAILPGSDFMTDGGSDAVRLAYSAVGSAQIEDGVALIGEAARSLEGAGV